MKGVGAIFFVFLLIIILIIIFSVTYVLGPELFASPFG